MFRGGGSFRLRMMIYDSTDPQFESEPRHSMKQRAGGSLFFYHTTTDSCAQPDANEKYIMQKINGCDDTEEQQKFTFGENYASR